MEQLLDGKLTLTSVETFRGRRYEVEGKAHLGGVIRLPGAPCSSRPQGDSTNEVLAREISFVSGLRRADKS